MEEYRYNQLKQAEKGAWISISAYILLAVMKVLIGIFAESEALWADGLNNFTDIIASISVLIGLRISRRPKDTNHQYGHWKFENIASLMTSFIMFMIGLEVLVSAFKNIINNSFSTPNPLSGVVGIVSALIMIGVYLYNSSLAKKVQSQALMAAAKDNLSDAYTSIGTTIAIVASIFNFHILDTITAFIIGIIILKTAFDIFKDSSFSLSDGFSKDNIDSYQLEIDKIEGVKGIKSIRARTYGANVFLEVTIYVEPILSVIESHTITEEIEKKLRDKFGVLDTYIHVEPMRTS